MALGTGLAIPFSMEDSSNMWLVAALTAFWCVVTDCKCFLSSWNVT